MFRPFASSHPQVTKYKLFYLRKLYRISWNRIYRNKIQRDLVEFYSYISDFSRSQWPRGLRRRSAAARLLGLWVRFPLGAYLSVRCDCCFVVKHRSLRRADHSSRGVLSTLVRRCVWSRNLKNEEPMVRFGPRRAPSPSTQKNPNI